MFGASVSDGFYVQLDYCQANQKKKKNQLFPLNTPPKVIDTRMVSSSNTSSKT